MHQQSHRPSLLQASLVPESPFLFLALRGELDMCSGDEVPLDDYASHPDLTMVLVDLGGLTFCDSTGLRALLAFRHVHAEQGRSVAVVRANPRIWRLLDLCGVTDRLEVAPPSAALATVIPFRPKASPEPEAEPHR